MAIVSVSHSGLGLVPGRRSTRVVRPFLFIEESGQVAVVANATAHTKGAWTELIASTSATSSMVVLSVSAFQSGADTATLIDIAVGGAGSEVAVLSNLPCGGAGPDGDARWAVPLPLSIPAGSRLSARTQSIVAGGKSSTVGVALLSGGSVIPAAALTVIGSNTSTSQGVEVGTSWTEITAATPATYRYLIPVPSFSSTAGASTTSSLVFGSGPASSEVEIGRVGVRTSAVENICATRGGAAWEAYLIMPGAAAGTRLVASRAQVCDVAVIGVP